MAEWLRRWTRNPLGSPLAGSNPANYDVFCLGSFFRIPILLFEINNFLYLLVILMQSGDSYGRVVKAMD